MKTAPTEEHVPVLDKDEDTNEWVLKVPRSAWLRIPLEQRALACQIYDAAIWSYRNGREDKLSEIHQALGIVS